MVFKNFRLQVFIRVLMLTLCVTLFAWCIVHALYLRSFYLGVAAVIVVAELIRYVDRFNRDVKTFMLALLQRDFTTHYSETGLSKSFDALYEMFNRISAAFEKISVEKEIQHRYLEMLVDHVQVGILSYDQHEKIHLANTSLKKLLQRPVIMQLETLGMVDEVLLNATREIKTGETKLVKIKVGQDLLHLSVHASEFRLDDQYFKLVSMQNIRTELDAQEMEAWQKLIRVMTHEIMNSISPITSLSATLHGLVIQHQEIALDKEPGLLSTLNQGLDAIRIRSVGLHNFTEAYRRLTRVPKPSFRKTNLKELLRRVILLFEREIQEKNIVLETRFAEVDLMLDPELIEQVIINLLRNSIEALAGIDEPHIRMECVFLTDGKVMFRIVDNGVGIGHETLENIFVPFFTTKKNGSGIGLPLAKQILQLHHAEIKVNSGGDKGVEFIILF